MNPSRLVFALAVLGAFVGGITLGMFLNSSPSSAEPVTRSTAVAESTVTHASGIAGSEVRHTEQSQAESELAGEDLRSRVWAVFSISDENKRHREWLDLIPSLTDAEAASVRELFRQLKAQGRRLDFEWSTFWPRWGELDGAAAIAQVSANEAADLQPAAAEMVLRGWTKMDSEAARAWLAANSSATFYTSALRGYLDGLARRDLARATQDLLVLGAGHDMGELVDTLAEQALQQRQLDGMLEWWRSLPDDPNDGSARRAAVGHVLMRLEEAEREIARTWLAELAATPYRNDGSIGHFAERLAADDPAGAVAWVASLPPGSDGHFTGIGRTIRAWVEKDKASADRWVASLPPSPLRDQAIEAQQQQTFVHADITLDGTLSGQVIQFFQGGTKAPIKLSPGASGSLEIIERK